MTWFSPSKFTHPFRKGSKSLYGDLWRLCWKCNWLKQTYSPICPNWISIFCIFFMCTFCYMQIKWLLFLPIMMFAIHSCVISSVPNRLYIWALHNDETFVTTTTAHICFNVKNYFDQYNIGDLVIKQRLLSTGH